MRIDTIIENANVITMDDERPSASRLGISSGRVIGLDDDLDGISATRTVDLEGATVTPGFNDAHCHTAWFGTTLTEIDVEDCTTHEELYAKLSQASRDLPPNAWVKATGLYPGRLGGQPDIHRLDEATGGRPLYLRHTSGHALTANTRAMELAGVMDPGFTESPLGAVPRDGSGYPIGLMDEAAQELVQDLVRPFSRTELVAAIDAATTRYASEGITSFTDCGVGLGWIGHSSLEIAAYQEALDEGRLHTRAQLMPVLDSLATISGNDDDMFGEPGRGLPLGIRSGFGSDRLGLGPVKVFMDGSLLGETSAVTEALCTGAHGHLESDPDELRHDVRSAYRAGWAIAVHAIGDRAIDVALDMIEGCQRDYGTNALPNRIEHAGVCRPDQVGRMAGLGLGGVTPQAAFIDSTGDQIMELVGPDREGWLYRGRSFLEAGVTVAGSSDRPVVDGRPLRGMEQAVNRRTRAGRVMGPEERVSPHEALAEYTVGSARATGFGRVKGRLAPGFLADLVVLDDDPLTVEDIAAVNVVTTVVAGRVVWGRDF